jgi:hypothetical protein
MRTDGFEPKKATLNELKTQLEVAKEKLGHSGESLRQKHEDRNKDAIPIVV